MSSKKKNAFFIRLSHWEYWPFFAVFWPIVPVYCWLSLRAKSFFFFSTSNPGIKNAGYDMESKFEIDKIIPEKFRPASLFFEPYTDIYVIEKKIGETGLKYPLIIKPDIGSQGLGVTKLNSDFELEEAVYQFHVPFIIQPFVPFENELGLFYVKMPDEEKGKITGIVRKEYLKVVGDGKAPF